MDNTNKASSSQLPKAMILYKQEIKSCTKMAKTISCKEEHDYPIKTGPMGVTI